MKLYFFGQKVSVVIYIKVIGTAAELVTTANYGQDEGIGIKTLNPNA